MSKIYNLNKIFYNRFFLLWFCSLVWAATAILYKSGQGITSGYNMAFLRLFFGAVFLIFFCKITKRKIFSTQNTFYSILIGLLNCSLPFALIGLSSTLMDSSVVAILYSTKSVFTFALSVFVLNQAITKRSFFAIVISVIGVVMIYYNVYHINFYAVFLVLLSNFSYALSSIIISKKLDKLDPVVISASSIVFGTIILLPIFVTTFNFNAFLNIQFTLSMIFLGLFGTAITYVAYFLLIQKYGANFASLNAFLVPIIGCFYGFILYGESITIFKIIAIIAILTGFFLLSRETHA